MADTPSPQGPFAEALRTMAPYIPVFAGALLSMAFGEKLTVRGKLLSAAVGVAAASWIAPVICDVLTLSLGGELLASVPPLVGFACGAFGMIMLSGLAQALAKYSRDPLSLVRIKLGPVEMGGES